MIRIVVADDQPLVRSGIAMILTGESDIEVVGEASNGGEAICLAKQLQPDIVLMDVRMPDTDGITATRTIASDQFSDDRDAPVKVLMLTTYNVQNSVHQALRAGASGFLLKDAVPADLVRAVRAVATGNGWLDPAVTVKIISEFASHHDPLRPTPAEMSELTSRERGVLVLVAQGLSNAEIAADLVISEATVKTHFGRILMKLNLRDRAQAVVVAYQTGLVQPGPPSSRSRPIRLTVTGLPGTGDPLGECLIRKSGGFAMTLLLIFFMLAFASGIMLGVLSVLALAIRSEDNITRRSQAAARRLCGARMAPPESILISSSGIRARRPTLRDGDQAGQAGPPGQERVSFWCTACQK